MTSEVVRPVLGWVCIAAALCLLLMYAGISWCGPVNDVLNAVIGWLAVALAVTAHAEGWGPRGAVAASAGFVGVGAGAVLMTWGTWLVMSGTTGFYLAGLVSTLGLAAIGVWFLLARPDRLALVVGGCLIVGVLALPGALSRVDDLATAPWHALASGIAWVGGLLLTVWALRARP